jgi:hypothetical protein
VLHANTWQIKQQLQLGSTEDVTSSEKEPLDNPTIPGGFAPN